MAKLTINGIRNIIREELTKMVKENKPSGGGSSEPRFITRNQLAQMCPQAEAGLDLPSSNTKDEVDHLGQFWYVESPEEAYAINGEISLLKGLRDFWTDFSVDGKVYFCGPVHEEYGLFWDESAKGWNSWTDTWYDDDYEEEGYEDDEDDHNHEIKPFNRG